MGNEKTAEVSRVIAILHTWGIHTLGQLAALDKQQLAERLGSVGVKLWERANGNVTRPLKCVKPPEIFEEAFEFEQEIETAEPLLFMLRRFLQNFAVRLGAIYFVTKELTLRITFSDKKNYERTFKIPEPTTDVELLFRMLQTHLENFTSDAPITAVSLRAEPAKPDQQQFGLFETALRNPAQLAETLARLAGLVGSDRVGTPALQDTHRPDAFRIEPFQWQLPDNETAATPLPRTALRRFRNGGAAVVFVENNQPAHIRSADLHGQVVTQAGPFASSGDWWDATAWGRAEWDMELENGVVCRCHRNAREWRVDGVYD
jgi:protein ImuB